MRTGASVRVRHSNQSRLPANGRMADGTAIYMRFRRVPPGQPGAGRPGRTVCKTATSQGTLSVEGLPGSLADG